MRRTVLYRGRRVASLVAVAGLLLGAAACGDDASGSDGDGGSYKPDGPVTIILSTSPGGGGDTFARTLAAGLEEDNSDLKLQVENRPGGNEVIAYSFFAQQEGKENFLLVASSALTILPQLVDAELDFSYEDYTPIAEIAEDQQMLVVNADSPYQTLGDLIDAAKTKKLLVAHASTGDLGAISVRLLEAAAGVTFDKVYTESGGNNATALLANDVDFTAMNPGEAAEQVRAGKFRPLAVFADKPYPEGSMFADVPTAQDEGYDIVVPMFRGLFAPGGISGAEKDFWIDAVEKWTKSDSYAKYIEENSLFPVFRSGDDFTEFLKGHQETLLKAL